MRMEMSMGRAMMITVRQIADRMQTSRLFYVNIDAVTRNKAGVRVVRLIKKTEN